MLSSFYGMILYNILLRKCKVMKQSKKLLNTVLFLFVICVFSISIVHSEPLNQKGSVYFFNFKPEADEAWQELAKLLGEYRK